MSVSYVMPNLQALGPYKQCKWCDRKQRRSKILWARLATEVPPQEPIVVQVLHEHCAAISQRLANARTVNNDRGMAIWIAIITTTCIRELLNKAAVLRAIQLDSYSRL